MEAVAAGAETKKTEKIRKPRAKKAAAKRTKRSSLMVCRLSFRADGAKVYEEVMGVCSIPAGRKFLMDSDRLEGTYAIVSERTALEIGYTKPKRVVSEFNPIPPKVVMVPEAQPEATTAPAAPVPPVEKPIPAAQRAAAREAAEAAERARAGTVATADEFVQPPQGPRPSPWFSSEDVK